jgi:hypothetical protein
MALNYGKSFQQVLRLLRREYPLTKPLRVVGKPLEQQRLCGCCLSYLNPDGSISRFVIEIDTGMSLLTAVDTLIHEYAHALDHDLNGIATEPHRESWGVCYARLWRLYTAKIE